MLQSYPSIDKSPQSSEELSHVEPKAFGSLDAPLADPVIGLPYPLQNNGVKYRRKS